MCVTDRNTLNQALPPRGASGSIEKEPLPEEGEVEPCLHHMSVGGIYNYQGFIQEFVLGGGNFVSGEQWACEGGVWRSSTIKCLRK